MTGEISNIINGINHYSSELDEVSIMEVCGTHTHEIHRLGINKILPENLKLVSGPGCPVCVTDESDIYKAMFIAVQPGVVLCCYGDMLRVPCNGRSLLEMRSEGADIRIVISSLDALRIAVENPDKQVVFFAVGFETTAPATAVLIKKAIAEHINNLSVICKHKTMPSAIISLLSENSLINGLLCPGNVAVITGRKAFDFVPHKLRIPAAVSGFDAVGILTAISALCRMLCEGGNDCINTYKSVVSENGNILAQSHIQDVFVPCDVLWRGLGNIPSSGLKIKEKFASYDAEKRFEVPLFSGTENNGCICASVLKGLCTPLQCPNFGKKCTPYTPVGPCMVSSEGSCAAFYKYDYCQED